MALTTPSDTADALNKLPSILRRHARRATRATAAPTTAATRCRCATSAPRARWCCWMATASRRTTRTARSTSTSCRRCWSRMSTSSPAAPRRSTARMPSPAWSTTCSTRISPGLTVKGDFGMSKYSDGDQYQFGAAWGTSLFSDRGHFEVAARMRHQDMIPMNDRPYGEDGQAWLQTGMAGSVEPTPSEFTPFSRVYNSGQHGNVSLRHRAAPSTTTLSMQNGNLVPLVHGTPPARAATSKPADDGAYIKYGTFRSELDSKDIFARFSLDLGESANWYVQGSWAQAENASDWIQWVVSPNAGRPNTLFANNPYLNADSREALGGNLNCTTDLATAAARAGRRCLIETPTAPRPAAPRRRRRRLGGRPHLPPAALLQRDRRAGRHRQSEPPVSHARRSEDLERGDRHYRRSGWFHLGSVLQPQQQRAGVTNPNNTDNAKYLASLDAVDDGGTIKCWVETAASGSPGSVSGLRSDEHHDARTAFRQRRMTTFAAALRGS